MLSGIYAISNNITNKRYIGSSTNVSKRWNSHKSCLRRSVHSNPHLQNSWNKYGENNFTFIVLEEVDRGCLIRKEENYLSQTDDKSII